jgi:MFS family permease
MLASDIIRGLVQVAVTALLMTHTAHLWHLVLASIVFSFAGGFFQPASTALTPQTVNREKLQQANALMGLTRSTTWVIGPAVSGVLVATVGPAWSYAIDSATFAVSAASLALLAVPPLVNPQRKNFWTELGDGIRAVASQRWYVLNLGAHAAWNFAFAAFMVAGPIVAKNSLGGASAWGFIAASMGAGSIVGGLIALRFMNEVWFATIPQLLPADVLARVTSFDWLLSIMAMPLGFAVTGPVADHIGIRTTLIVAAFIMAVPCALIVLVPGVRNVKRNAEGRVVLEGA